ncbi:arabinosyltransferase domain-containing protein [Allokutzneria oryzae]|uniref:Arabinosyltransferase domain-containing protein n=1 Tax=Allokutzneria oryzae TaxID=1378989 RepID=A0ABV6A149_9PSEU
MSTPFSRPRARTLVLVAGLISVLSALLVPFAPVNQDKATFSWPVEGSAQPVQLLLYPYQPASLDATFSCATVAEAARRGAERTVVLSTTPDTEEGRGDGLVVETAGSALTISNRGRLLHREQVDAQRTACSWRISSTSTGTTVTLDGRRVAGVDSDARPHVLGVFSTVDGAVRDLDGLSVRVVADTRFQTSPSVWKYGLMALSVIALAVALLALRRADRERGLPVRRLLPERFWRPRAPDYVVGGTVLGWAVIGSLTVDDGYILTMIRAREATGFVGNYYRWFNAPEAPFGYFYELYYALTRISDSLLWMRLPAVGLAITAWLLLSRLVLPRLGGAFARSRWVPWGAAAVFLAWWLPYNNGIRPEPFIVVGTLGVFCAVERVLATRRLLPLAFGVLVAVAAVGITPTGVIAFLPMLVAPRRLLAVLRERSDLRWMPLLSVVAASGLFGLLLMFYDQTFSAVMEATRSRSAIGPSLTWDTEFERYARLLNPIFDEGSLTRRVPVLMLLASLALVSSILLRHKRIHGVATGPAVRLLSVTVLSLGAIAFTPTKWTHHFGAFAGLGVAVVVLGMWALSTPAFRSTRARAAAVCCLMVAFALALSSPNRWWLISAPDGPWTTELPNVFGIQLNTALLVVGVLVALAAVTQAAWRVAHRRPERPTWLPSPALIMVIGCAASVVLQVGTFVVVTEARTNTYSLAKQNVRSVLAQDCGLASALKVEPTPERGILTPLPGEAGRGDVGPFAVNGGYDPEHGPPYLFDKPSTGVPVWGSLVDGDRTTGTATTGWYRVDESLRRGNAPLVLSVAGRLHGGNEIALEFGATSGEEVRPRGRMPVDSPLDGPQWRDVRIDVREAVADADAVRVVATDSSVGAGGWLAFSPPKAPVLVPMPDVVPSTDATIIDWPVAALFPCNRPAALRLGTVEMPHFRIGPAGGYDQLTGMSYSAQGGGPFAPVNALATQQPLPTYLVNDWQREAAVVYRIVPTQHLGLPEAEVHREQVSGIGGPGRLNTPGTDDPMG